MPPESRQDSKGRLGRFFLLLNKTDQNIEILFSRCKMGWIVWIAVTLVGINAVCGQEGAIEFKYTLCTYLLCMYKHNSVAPLFQFSEPFCVKESV